MRRSTASCVVGAGLCVLLLGAAVPKFDKAWKALEKALDLIVQIEPDQEGALHDEMRGAGAIIHDPSPTVVFVDPLDGDDLTEGEPIVLTVDIANWIVDPSKATNAATEFAIGKQEHNTGHTHVWIYNMDTGARVRFTGANGLLPTGVGGLHTSAPFTLPVGRYKAYVQLQNHDHTAAYPATAPTLPGIDSLIFTVSSEL